MHQIQTGLREVEPPNFQPPVDERNQAQSRRYLARAQHGLGPECGIVIHDQILQIESRPRQQPNLDRADFDRPPNARTDGRNDPRFQAGGAWSEQKQCQQDQGRTHDHAPFGGEYLHNALTGAGRTLTLRP
jgi:hypothetical protein